MQYVSDEFLATRGPRSGVKWAAALALPLAVAGCALGSGGAAPSTAVPVLACTGGPGAGSLAGAWRRDVLVIDLTGIAGDGECTLSPPGPGGWPERLALRVLPGVTPALEIDADQRLRLPAAAAAGSASELVLPHALHSPATPQIRLRWGAAAAVGSAIPPPGPATPGAPPRAYSALGGA